MSTGEHDPSGWALVKKSFFYVMQWASDMDIPMDVPLVDEH